MITLSEAFRLCDVRDEPVYLRHVEESNSVWNTGHYFWSKKIRDKLDMRKIRVIKIEPAFEHFGPEFIGWRFIVAGITPEELTRIEHKGG